MRLLGNCRAAGRTDAGLCLAPRPKKCRKDRAGRARTRHGPRALVTPILGTEPRDLGQLTLKLRPHLGKLRTATTPFLLA